MDWVTIILSLLCSLFGAIIGTYGGAWWIERVREQKTKKIRDIAITSLNIFRTYPRIGNNKLY